MGGTFAGDSLAFRNPDGSLVLELYNPFKRLFTVEAQLDAETIRLDLEPQSVNSIVFEKGM